MRYPLFLVCLVILSLIGCGGSSGGSGAVSPPAGSGSAPAPSPPAPLTGSVSFDFLRAQTAWSVPADTVSLRFVFTDRADGEGALLLEASRPFAPSVTISGVPVAARSVRVTALGGEGQPLLTALAPVAVLAGQTSTVSFPAWERVVATELVLDPSEVELRVGGERQLLVTVRLSDGSTQVATGISWSQSGNAALVDSAGTVTAVTPGQTSVTARLGALAATSQVSVLPPLPEELGQITLQSFELSSDSFTLTPGATLQVLAVGTFSNGTVRLLSQAQDGLNFSSADDGVATVDDEGRVIAVAAGSTSVLAEVGALTQTLQVTVQPGQTANQPVIDFHASYRTAHVLGEGPYPVAPTVTVSDVHADLGGGQLTLSNYETGAFQAPSTPVLGTISGNGTQTLTVALQAGVTPAQVTAFLRGVTLAYSGPQRSFYVLVQLDNGHQQTANATTILDVRSDQVLHLTVNPGTAAGGNNFQDLQPAIERVEGYGADGSTIDVVAGDFRIAGFNQGNYVVWGFDGPEFSILGANARVSAGVSPGTRGPETTLASINLEVRSARAVTIDGLTLHPNKTNAIDGPTGISSWERVFRATNCRFLGTQVMFGLSTFGLYQSAVVVEDCSFENVSGAASIYYGGTVFHRNVFRDNRQGISLSPDYAQNEARVEGNLFVNSVTSHLNVSRRTQAPITISGNAFLGTGTVALSYLSTFGLDARYNWWGQDSGPLPSQLSNESTLAEVWTAPFLTTNPIP